nr:Chromosome partition protein like [Ipomoea batatas]
MDSSVELLDGKDAMRRVCVQSEYEYCRQCLHLEDTRKEACNRCADLELEIEGKKNEVELLQHKLVALEGEKIAVENELQLLKRNSKEIEAQETHTKNVTNSVMGEGLKPMGGVVDLTEEEIEGEDEVFRLMTENKVLECEKRKAESDIEVWKGKCKEMQLLITELEKKLVSKDGNTAVHNKEEMNEHRFLQNASLASATLDGLQAVEEVTKLDGTIHPKAGMETSGTESKHENGEKDVDHIRKRIRLVEEGHSNKKIAPCTPSGVKSAVNIVIDIDGSDEDTNGLCMPSLSGSKVVGSLPDYGIGNSMSENKLYSNNNIKISPVIHSDDDYDDLIGPNSGVTGVPCISTPKRKRAYNIVVSDNDSDDDNLPLCTLMIRHSDEQPRDNHPKKDSMESTVSEDEVKGSGSRRRLVKLKSYKDKGDGVKRSLNYENNCGSKCHHGISASGDDDDVGDDESDNEGESLDSFIVKDDDDDDSNGDGVSDSNDGSNNNDASAADDSSFDPEIASDNDETFGEIISRIRRKKTHKLEWDYEADMLAAFAEVPELCMKAVCALYRMQTDDEKNCKSTMYMNERGFSQCDAYRGSQLAQFLTDGNPKGDVIKSVKELQEHDPKGLEKCWSLAQRYSKQLFEIYKNKEDPLFLPS